MDMLSLIDLIQEMLPGTIVDAKAVRKTDGMDMEFTITKVDAVEVEDA